MIDLKDLRDRPDRYRDAARLKGIDVDVDALVQLDGEHRRLLTEQQELQAEKNRIGREIGRIAGRLKQGGKAEEGDKAALKQQMAQLQKRPSELKERERVLAEELAAVEPRLRRLWLKAPQPPDPDVPVGASADDNVPLRSWHPSWFDPAKTFADNQGFAPRTHLELGASLGLFDFERGVKMAGARSYVLTGAGMRLHNAVCQFALNFMINDHGFTPMSVPVLVREEMMTGTGFFPSGRDQAYEINEKQRDSEGRGQDTAHASPTVENACGHDLYLTGTGEVGLMGLYSDEILAAEDLPRKLITLSTCFRREAGSAGKDTAGLYRIHQFDKVEQVVICRADEAESRSWHKTMIGYVETLLRRLELPYRLLQCCTADLGPKNADMIDLEAWMPGRGAEDANGRPRGAYGETHSASRLYDYQCRRLNLRYRDPDDPKGKRTIFCHSLNNTVAASPRLLIPILEMYQNEDGSVTVPEALRPYMNGQARIG